MTILQTQKELERAIEHINTEFTGCRKNIIEVFGEEILSPVSDNFSMMLEVKTESELFTDQERGILEAVNGLVANILQAHSIYLHEESRINKAKKEREDYPERISADNETDLDLYIDQLKKLDDRMTAPYKELMYLSSNVQSLGWKRYFDNYEGRNFQVDTRKECKAIANSLHILSTGFETKEESEDIPGMLKFLEKYGAVSVLGRIDTEYYGKTVRVVLQTSNIAEKDRRKVLKDLIEPLFARHKEALKERRLPAEDALRDIIDDTLDRLLRELTPLVKGDSTEMDFPPIKRKPIKDYSMNTSALMRDVFSGNHAENYQNQISIYEYLDEKSKEVKTVSTYYAIDYNNLEGVTMKTPLTPDQTTLYNAIDSEFKAGNNIVTTAQIYKTMLGGDSSATLPQKKREEIVKTIDRLASIRVSVDNSEYAKRKGKNTFISARTNLLSIDQLEEKRLINGKLEKDLWIIKERPLLSRYAESIGQIRDIPMKLMRTGTGVVYTPLRDHLLAQILYMQNQRQKRKNCKILLAPVYQNLYKGADTKKQQRLTESAEKMLKTWIREGLIYSYEFELSKRTRAEIAKAEAEGRSTQDLKKVAISIYIFGENDKLTTEAQKNRIIALERKSNKRAKK